MKTKLRNKMLVTLFILPAIIPGCKKVELPAVKTVEIIDITEMTATVHYKIISDGGGSVTYHGVCWNSDGNPTTSLITKTVEGGPYGGAFGDCYTSLTGLAYGNTYHVRAYATNSAGTAYGEDKTFSTRDVVAPGGIKTKPVSALSSFAAISGGRFSSLGGASSVECGVCWSESPNPTTGSYRIFDNYWDTLTFTSIMTNLSPNTIYFARAYASNQAETVYGSQITFTTTGLNVTDAGNNKYHTTNIGTQVWLMENLATTKYNDGNPITMVTDQASWDKLTTPAYCWYNNEKPASDNFSGALYNWHAVNTGKLCPTGFHVPAITEWEVLTTYLGGLTNAGNEMRKPDAMQWPYEGFGGDSCLFWGVTCGIRDTIIGFEQPGGCGGGFTTSHWWSSTPATNSTAWSHMLFQTETEKVDYSRKNGFSVRCLKD